MRQGRDSHAEKLTADLTSRVIKGWAETRRRPARARARARARGGLEMTLPRAAGFGFKLLLVGPEAPAKKSRVGYS